MSLKFREEQTLVCECGWIGVNSEKLYAPQPFQEGESISACPQCREIDRPLVACSVNGCKEKATCGTKAESRKYRFVCSGHYREISGITKPKHS